MRFPGLPSKAGIYVGWTGRADLGDEAMLSVCRELFQPIHWSTFEESAAQPAEPVSKSARQPRRWGAFLGEELRTWRRVRLAGRKGIRRLALAAGGEVALFGGGTLLNDRGMLAEYRAVRQQTGRPVPVFGSGVSDPSFWSADPTWRDEREGWIAALAELPVVGVRGPRSKQLLDEAGATNVIVSGDPAVMLHQPMHSSGKTPKKLSIGLNCGTSKRAWGSLNALNDTLGNVARALAGAGNGVEIIPVWPEDVPVCEQVAAAAGVRSLPAITSATAYLDLVKKFDVVITTKLHAAVLAAAANVPFVMIEYQPKCRDFTASIGWERFTIRSDAASQHNILEAVYSLQEDLPDFQTEVCESMCALQNRFKLYCETIRPLLLA